MQYDKHRNSWRILPWSGDWRSAWCKLTFALDYPTRSWWLPSGKHTENYGKSPFLKGKPTKSGHFQ
jgi:hypothetical protein